LASLGLMACLRILLIACACFIASTPPFADMASCTKLAEDALSAMPLPTPKNLQPGITHEQYKDILTSAFATMLTECARQECNRDVRECIKVREYEDTEAKWRRKITEPAK
jgi:hypothetical protein